MSDTAMEASLRAELRDHAWRSFTIHADQRLKTFHFFVLLSAVVAGGLFTLLKDGQHLLIGALLTLLFPFLAFVFWKLECRNRQLVKLAEAALKAIEAEWQLPNDGGVPHPAQVFMAEEHATAPLPRFPRASLRVAHFSYSNCFNIVFAAFGFGGSAVALILFVMACLTTA